MTKDQPIGGKTRAVKAESSISGNRADRKIYESKNSKSSINMVVTNSTDHFVAHHTEIHLGEMEKDYQIARST